MNQNVLSNLLTDKIAVITGANRGIGKGIVDLFKSHGASIIACERTPSVKKPNDRTIALDLSDEHSVNNAIKEIRQLTKHIDILVNCAGVADGATFQLTSIKKMRQLFDINVFNTLLFTQGLSRMMGKKQPGSIVNISSSTAQFIERGTLSYGASKAAIERITYSLALELGSLGIRVNAIAPGITETDMAKQMTPDAYQALINKSILKKSASVLDIANTALFLSSDLSSH